MSNLGKVDFSNKVNKPRMSFSPLGLLPPPDPQQQKPLRQERQPEMAIGADKIVIPQQVVVFPQCGALHGELVRGYSPSLSQHCRNGCGRGAMQMSSLRPGLGIPACAG
uniref:Uncharacterized protein n=1 Tax=Oryza rufipogon TaxID=4529 RepID=A0A0E0REY6_ORYRU